MALHAGSRYSFALGVRDEQGRLFLTEREPYGFHEHSDTRTHRVQQGDTLWALAGRYFAPPPRVLFVWPEVVTAECVVGSVEFQYRQLGVDGTVLVYMATVGFEEIRLLT